MATTQVIVEVFKHLPGQHDQQKHGLKEKIRDFVSPKVTIYHGSVDYMLSNILAQGIKPSSETNFRNYDPSVYEGHQDKVFVTTDYVSAISWGKAAQLAFKKFKPVPRIIVFEAKVPARRLEVSELGEPGDYRISYIAPEQIKRFNTFEYVDETESKISGKVMASVKLHKALNDMVTVYVPILVAENENH